MVEIHKRSRLPHWKSSATYFVTFNLFDAIPLELVGRLRIERNIGVAELERLKMHATAAEIAAIDQVIRERTEEHLDSNLGSCFMNDHRRVASVVATAL